MMIGDVNRLSATEPFPSIGFQIITLIEIIAVSFGVQMFLSRPELGAMALGVIPSPELLHNRDMLYVAIGILGATVMPHNLYLHSSIVQTRHYKLTPEGKREAIFFWDDRLDGGAVFRALYQCRDPDRGGGHFLQNRPSRGGRDPGRL
jgi:hypothetical protein